MSVVGKPPLIVAVTSLTAVLLAGCGGGERAGSEPSPVSAGLSTPAGQSATPLELAERDAVAAYRGFVAAWVDAARVADPDAPALRQYARGPALAMVVNALFGNRMQHKVVLGEPVIDPKPVDAQPAGAPDRVTLSDCLDSTRWLEHKASGELWDDVPGGRRLAQVVVVRTDVGWQVESMSAEPKGSC